MAGEIERSEELFAVLGCGLWTIREKLATEIVGLVGLGRFFIPPELRLVCAPHLSYWGRGLATEAAQAIIQYGFGPLGFERIEAAPDIPNTSFIRATERLGMVFDRQTDDGDAGRVFYALDQAL